MAVSVASWLRHSLGAAAFSFAASSAMAQAPAAAQEVPAAPTQQQPGHYFLVIDHSGSMLKQIAQGPAKGRTRWDLMRERAAGFIERLPANSEAWAIIFSARDPAAPQRDWQTIRSARLDSQASRERLIGQLRSHPEPGPANGTWLYQATDTALDQVEIAGARNPDAFLTVMVYTDGVDEGHGQTRAEMLRNPGSQVTREQRDRRVQRLKQRYRNFNLIDVYQPGDESIRDAHVVRLSTNRLQLANPAVIARQEAALDLSFRDNDTIRLAGRPLNLALDWPDGSPMPLRVVGGPFKLASGRLAFAFERTGDWPPGKDVRARLKLGYPSLADSFLVAEGGEVVDVLIQGAEAPAIRDLLPAAGAVFPVGREVSFSLTTLPGAVVDWDFGDGRSARGNPVRHAFSEPAKRKVSVKVTDPRTQLSSTASVALEAVRLSIKLDPAPVGLVPDKRVTLSATADGDFERFEWNVDGRLYAGARRSAPQPGTSLEIAFERPGPVRVSVAGEGRSGGRVEAEPVVLEVKEVPTLRVTSPAAGQTLHFGASREFRAEIEGVAAQRVRFSLRGADGAELLPPKEVDVARQGALRQAVAEERIPELQGKVRAVLRVEVLEAVPPLSKDVLLNLEREPTTLEVMFPEGLEPYVLKPTPVRLQSNAKLTDVRWDFGEGKGFVAGGEVERHTWARYGNFSVRAVARDPDGQEVESAPVAVKVPVRAVSVIPQLLLGGRAIGADADRVPINATLQLAPGATGDVQRVRWFLDDAELPGGQQTVTVSERGERRLKLVAEGTPQAGSAEATIVFRASDPWVFWGGLAVLLGAIAVLARLLLGNKWRLAEFQVLTQGDTWSPESGMKALRLDTDPRYLGPPGNARNCGSWNPWTKAAKISMPSLDNKLAIRVRQSDEGAAFVPPWIEDPKAADLLLFRGDDPKPEPVGRLRVGNAKVLVRTAAAATQLDHGRADAWLRCWTVQRPLSRSGSRFATLRLFMRLRPAGVLRRYWPEGLFAVCCVAAAALARHLHSTYY